jgi:glycerol-1-phosphate dehydrogenase [NAD(P)+]
MAAIHSLAHADPSDLAGLRAALKAADPEGRLKPIGLKRIEIGSDVLGLLPEIVAQLTPGGRVVLVMDGTPMRRNGADLKALVARVLAQRFALRPLTLGGRGAALHADEQAVAAAAAAVAGADCVVVVGSGTITDLCKEATAQVGRPPLVVVQTAASVNAFSDDLAVLLKSGTKRTVPSRWPDALLIDLETLASAPPAMNLAGFGDLTAMWCAPADWYLASIVGMDDAYHPAPATMLRDQGRLLLRDAGALRRREPAALDRLARVLTLSGIAMGVAGKTAPLSGTEHLVSHLIDMAAEQRGLPLAFHGAQVGAATILAAMAWEIVLSEFNPAAVAVDRCFPEPAALESMVRTAFAVIDPSGRVGDECWSDYSQKVTHWRTRRPLVERFFAGWARYHGALSHMVVPAADLAAALAAAGAPTRFQDLDPPVAPHTVRWALQSCHLMRNRFTLADLLFFLGWWNDAFVERVLDGVRAVGGGL